MAGMWRSHLFWRLFVVFGGVMLAAIGLLGALLTGRVEQYESRRIREQLEAKAILVAELTQDWTPRELVDGQARLRRLGHETRMRMTLLDRAGQVLADSDEDPAKMENHADRPEVQAASQGEFGLAQRYSATLKQWMIYVARSVSGTGPVAIVRVARPLDEIEHQLAALKRIVWTTAGGTAVMAMLIAFALARRITLPLEELTHGASQIAGGQFGQKVYVDAGDEVGALAASFNHMSLQLEAQFRQLQEDRDQLRTILASMVEGVVAVDADQRVVFANEQAGRLLGLATPLAVGRKLWELVRQPPLQEIVRRALADPEPFHGEWNWDGGSNKWLTVQAARLPGYPSRGAVLVLHDTSELRRLERIRQDFVANVSHELKTPLSVIKVCVETLQDGADDDPVHRARFLDQIAEQSDRLHALILDLLSLARIESEAEQIELQPVSLPTLIAECLEHHQARARAKRQELVRLPEPAPRDEIIAWADEEALNQILDNLVDNALKYTPEGGRITVRCWAENGQVGFEVADTGIGIPEADLPRIFERFYRVDKARSRELGGTGLGLSIVKHLAQAMHGTVEAQSHLGQGTAFQVRLPRAAPLPSEPV